MTVLYAYDQTDLTSYNLNFWYANMVFEEFNDDANEDGYEDNYHIYTDTNDALSLYGSGFAYELSEMYWGTIEALSQWAWVPDDSLVNDGFWEERWHWEGLDMMMSTFWEAGQTADLEDDLSVIKTLLSGADTFHLSEYDDAIQGFSGNDTMFGRDGDDVLEGNNGHDQLFGSLGHDELYGGRGGDLLSGGQGSDTLDGGVGGDTINGGDGGDEMYGGGGSGADTMSGGRGRDYIDGESGNDILNGGGGDDTLVGGAGDDTMSGDGGEDLFRFSTGDDKDTISDFDAIGSKHDVLDLSGLASVTDWLDLSSNHMTQVGADVVIDGNNGDEITLMNVDLADLDQDDFIFSV